MDYNSLLPALVPAVVALFAISIAAGFALAWVSEPRLRLIVRRLWIFAVAVVVGCVAAFWTSTVSVWLHTPATP